MILTEHEFDLIVKGLSRPINPLTPGASQYCQDVQMLVTKLSEALPKSRPEPKFGVIRNETDLTSTNSHSASA